MSMVLAATPQVTAAPTIDGNGILRIVGAYPTNPALEFDLSFQYFGGIWRPAGLAVNLLPPAVAAPPNPSAGVKPAETKKTPGKK